MAKCFYKRLRQSQQDRTLVTVKYRCKGDSKDKVVTMQRCKVLAFHQSTPPTIDLPWLFTFTIILFLIGVAIYTFTLPR